MDDSIFYCRTPSENADVSVSDVRISHIEYRCELRGAEKQRSLFIILERERLNPSVILFDDGARLESLLQELKIKKLDDLVGLQVRAHYDGPSCVGISTREPSLPLWTLHKQDVSGGDGN